MHIAKLNELGREKLIDMVALITNYGDVREMNCRKNSDFTNALLEETTKSTLCAIEKILLSVDEYTK